jgi:hypothetical protein
MCSFTILKFMQDGCDTETMSRISTLDEEGWKVRTLMSVGYKQKATNLRYAWYHEELWTPKV